jgi:rhodanese-related sulfurtransferase/membrane protein insertase Oxa1/YidC/SpoIIIJ/phosphohistidine swiveling domain-containing protein
MRPRAWAFRPRFEVWIVLLFVLPSNAWAIPSPDVMINLFASSTQVLGIVSLILGRWFIANRGRRASGAGQGTYRTAFWVALGLCVMSSTGWYLYHARVRDDQLARLTVNLNRNSSEEGRKIVDVSLKELAFSDQLQRGDGISTEEFARWTSSEQGLQVLDVRESEEVEVGAIAGTRPVRFPDVLAAPEQYIDKSREVVLLCFNGNRSSELAAHFEELGYDCRFMIGGYEKWLAEDRPLVMQGENQRKSLREIPDYPNKDVLLDTPDVVELVENSEPLFVDVRYPGDFEVSHLPGAVNIPMRKLTTPELDAALAALPRRPIITACYDKRSSFFGLVIGLRLHRLGYQYLGRYTTPEGYAVQGKDKPHVAAWKAAHAPKSLLALVGERFEVVLTWLEGRLGSMALAILVLVLALRVALTPLTVRAERDRQVQAGLAPRLRALKERFSGDPQTQAQASSRVLDEAGVRPMFNLVAAVAQLVLFTVFFTVVQRLGDLSTEPFLWLDQLGKSDPTRILPVAVALLGGTLVALVTPRRFALWLAPLVAFGLGALVWQLSGAVDLYLGTSLLLVIAQSLAVEAWLTRAARKQQRRTRAILARYEDAVVVPLEHAHIVPGCGNKAARLAHLIAAGLPVPGGFVVRSEAITVRARFGRFSDQTRAAIESAHRAMHCERVAVRSSGDNEDGTFKSYAGVFDSVLDVTAATLFEALDSVAESLSSQRVGAYTNGARESGAILVQAMVPASFAGVLFTEHPGQSGAAAIELVAGLGDALVSGRAQPRTFALGRYSGRVLDGGATPIGLEPLFALGRQVEELFGKPQDIEWAFASGRFQLLQARDITRTSRDGADGRALRERERARLLELARGAASDEVVLVQNELTELLPEPTPFSLALMEALWAHGGSTHRACRALNIPYDVAPDSPPFAVSAFNVLCVNQREALRRMRRGPSSVSAFRLARAADELERAWREDFLPDELRMARLREALDLSRFTLCELTQLFAERRTDFVTRSYARAEEINIAADFYLKAALRALKKKGLDPAEHLAHAPKTVVHEAMELLARVGRGQAQTSEFLAVFGHRAPRDYELADPRYAEAPQVVRSMSERLAAGRTHDAPPPVAAGSRVLAIELERARRYQTLKEEAKHHALRDLAFLRRVLLELGARTGLGERVFQLVPEEVERLAEAGFVEVALARADARLEQRDALASVKLGLEVRLSDLEGQDLEHGDLLPRRGGSKVLVGTRVSGSGAIVGRVRVLRTADEIDAFQRNEILVARFTDPTWMSVFPLARGIVTEVGGWLSHAAIQAREYGITAVVGTAGALEALSTGDLVRIREDGAIERLGERRAATRMPVDHDVRLSRRTGSATARLNDLSTTGALISRVEPPLEIGEDIGLEIEGELRDARVTRNGIPGIYGVEWAANGHGSHAELLDPV